MFSEIYAPLNWILVCVEWMDPFHDKLIAQAPTINMYWGQSVGRGAVFPGLYSHCNNTKGMTEVEPMINGLNPQLALHKEQEQPATLNTYIF